MVLGVRCWVLGKGIEHLFFTHCSNLTAQSSPLTAQSSWLTAQSSWLTAQSSQLKAHSSQLIAINYLFDEALTISVAGTITSLFSLKSGLP